MKLIFTWYVKSLTGEKVPHLLYFPMEAFFFFIEITIDSQEVVRNNRLPAPLTQFLPTIAFAKLWCNISIRILTLIKAILIQIPPVVLALTENTGSKDERRESKYGGECS